ncbi:hypothetical protein NTGHW29_140068 [Candidatus Nitrotoga sp. HW29]|nr:hypothetical protein NTGHW29_140068 [Candidatus Nitrotoga sp. HW29]
MIVYQGTNDPILDYWMWLKITEQAWVAI